MNQRDEIVNALAKASSLQEQANLVSALDAFDRGVAARSAEDRQVAWADTVVTATLSPVAVHERSTIETDWLGEVTSSAEVGPQVIAEAAAWYGRVHEAVKADPEEFAEQAKGIARRTASAYGEQAAGAESSFLEYVHFLNRHQAASGLPQVQQLVDAHENPAQQSLPTDVFDTFGPPVHPINQGVNGTETSERAPLIQEIEGEGGGGSSETHHDSTQQFAGPAPVEARPGVQGTTASRETFGPDGQTWFTPTVGLSHTATINDFMPGGRFHKEADVSGATGHDYNCRTYDTLDASDCNCGGQKSSDQAEVRPESRHNPYQAASGLPQVQQIVDAKDENPAPTPLPEEVAFPWDLEEAPEIDERSDHKASIERKRAMALAYLRGLVLQPTATLTDVQRLQAAAYRKHADQWTQGNPQYHGPGAANSPATTPEGTGGSRQEGYAEGQSDWRGDEAPTFADASSAVSPFVQGHSEGYGDAARSEPTAPGGATPGQMPPGAGGFGSYQTHAASKTAATAAKMNCANCGRQDNSFNMTIRGNGSSQDAWCSNCKPVAANHGQSDSTRVAPVTRSASVEEPKEVVKTSSLFVTAVEMADPDFAKAYKYASAWTPGKPLVRRHASKVAFEAGLYAGISDNPANQRAWGNAHHAAAQRYNDKGFTDRLDLHNSFTQKVAKAMPSLRVQAGYVTQPVEKTANLSCPNCQSKNITLTVKPGGSGSGPGGSWRMGDQGGQDVTDCKDCGAVVPTQPRYSSKTAATSTELDTSSPGVSPSPTGQTPINGPGTPPPLSGGNDPAAPGGPAPYNGAPPFGAPVVGQGPAAHGQPLAIDTQPGAPVDGAAYEHLSPQVRAFRQTVAANLVAQGAVPPFARSAAEQKYPVCNGCGESFDSREVAEQAHGKRGCGTKDDDNTGYRMVPESEAW